LIVQIQALWSLHSRQQMSLIPHETSYGHRCWDGHLATVEIDDGVHRIVCNLSLSLISTDSSRGGLCGMLHNMGVPNLFTTMGVSLFGSLQKELNPPVN
jgi:hypothetical protein